MLSPYPAWLWEGEVFSVQGSAIRVRRGTLWGRGLLSVVGRPGLCAVVQKVKVAQSCPTLCDPMDYTVHGILQARVLEWVAMPSSMGSSQPRDQTQVCRIAGRFFTS